MNIGALRSPRVGILGEFIFLAFSVVGLAVCLLMVMLTTSSVGDSMSSCVSALSVIGSSLALSVSVSDSPSIVGVPVRVVLSLVRLEIKLLSKESVRSSYGPKEEEDENSTRPSRVIAPSRWAPLVRGWGLIGQLSPSTTRICRVARRCRARHRV